VIWVCSALRVQGFNDKRKRWDKMAYHEEYLGERRSQVKGRREQRLWREWHLCAVASMIMTPWPSDT
jgi:hypothetical protein